MGDNLSIPSAGELGRVVKPDIIQLPVFSPVMARLLEICNDPDASMEEMAKLAETDVGISTRILQIVNSAFYGLKRKISEISEAVLYLGIDETKKNCLGVTVFEKMIKPKPGRHFDRIFFWRHCLCVASLSRSIAMETGYVKPAEAYTAGLLHDFGKIIFDIAGQVNYGDFICRATSCAGHLVDRERAFMGMGHDDVGSYYSKTWKLPESLSLVVKYHHISMGRFSLSNDEMQLISIVSLANFLAWSQGMGSINAIQPPALQPEVDTLLNFNDIDFKKIIEQMDAEIQSTAHFYRFTFPTASQFRENLLKANLKLSAINAVHYFKSEKVPSNRAGSGTDAKLTMASLTAPHRSLDPKRIITNTLKAIYDDFNFGQIFVMKISKPKRYLYVSESMVNGQPDKSQDPVRLPINKNAGGLIHCLREKGPVLIKGESAGEQAILKNLGVDELLIVPFCSRNKVLGILGMGMEKTDHDLQAHLFSPVAIVANELGIALQNATAYKQARSVSLHDGLTGLLNRMALDRLLRKSFRKAVDKENELSLAMIDVDFFKKFNDQFGHQSGDSVLKLIAHALKKLSRPFDHVGRYGGEEFIVVLNETTVEEARIYAERIRKEIENLGLLLRDRFPGLALTVSIGVGHYTRNLASQDELVAIADKALYQAKKSGRNRVVG